MENEDEPRRTVTLTQFDSDDLNWYVYNEEGVIIGHLLNFDTEKEMVICE